MSYVPSPAGFWKRYVAYFIDLLLVSTVLNVVMSVGMVAFGVGGEQWLQSLVIVSPDAPAPTPEEALLKLAPLLGWMLLASTVGYVVLAAGYFIAMEASPRQATLGKQLLGLKVTAIDGGPPGLGRATGRFVAATLSWLTLNLGHALAGWTRERRALHDYLAGTRVENVDPANTAMPVWGWLIIALHVVAMLVFALLTLLAAWLIASQAGMY